MRLRLVDSGVAVQNLKFRVKSKKFAKKYTPVEKPYYVRKVFFDGKTYKLSIKSTIWHFRFNRVNRTIFYPHNLYIYTRGLRKKLYIYNVLTKKLQRKVTQKFIEIRKYNTYTVRGLYTTNMVINKRVGRVSEYV